MESMDTVVRFISFPFYLFIYLISFRELYVYRCKIHFYGYCICFLFFLESCMDTDVRFIFMKKCRWDENGIL